MDYSRQISLIGTSKQESLADRKVAVIGAGGLGSFVAMGLAASGVGHLFIVDFDQVSKSNLHRQFLYNQEDIGRNKAEVLVEKIQRLNPEVQCRYIPEFLNNELAEELFKKVDIIVDCVDHMPTKYRINDVALSNDKPLVYGSLYKYDAYWGIFNVNDSAHLRDFFPDSENQVDLSCEEVGILNPIVNLCAAMQVNLVLNYFLKNDLPLNQLVIYNINKQQQFVMKASENRSRSRVYKETDLERSWVDFNPEEDALYGLIDFEYTGAKIQSNLTQQTFEEFVMNLEGSRRIFVYCQRGISSLRFVKEEHATSENDQIYSVEGGLKSLQVLRRKKD
ncbi:MAG: HesA/MoeB/ThiF family protein [Flavobacteriaceae bacterium]